MGLTCEVFHDKRCLVVHVYGAVQHQDLLDFQREMGLHWQAQGYDALVIVEPGTAFPTTPLSEHMATFATEVAHANHHCPPTRLAIAAPAPLGYGLARMYLAHREMAGGRRVVQVFRSEDEAWRWLAEPPTEEAPAASREKGAHLPDSPGHQDFSRDHG